MAFTSSCDRPASDRASLTSRPFYLRNPDLATFRKRGLSQDFNPVTVRDMASNPPVDLVAGAARSRILPAEGLTVATFTIGSKQILYPDGMIDMGGKKKRRGGIPILFPQAGALPERQPEGFHLAQHGFARDLPWETLGVSADRAQFRLRGNPDVRSKYPFDFELLADISLSPSALDYKLVFRNPSGQIIWGAPGLHPYFAIPPQGRSEVGTNVMGFSIPTYRMDQSIIMPPQRVDLDIPGLGRVTMIPGKDFLRIASRLVVWSDHPEYMCFEPWSAGVGDLFEERRRVELSPNQESVFTMRIEVKCAQEESNL